MEISHIKANSIDQQFIHKVWMLLICVFGLSVNTTTAQICQTSENDEHKKSWGWGDSYTLTSHQYTYLVTAS